MRQHDAVARAKARGQCKDGEGQPDHTHSDTITTPCFQYRKAQICIKAYNEDGKQVREGAET